jgi:hypothetical protein
MNEQIHATIRASHIERSASPFFVRFTRLAFVNEYLHPESKKLIKVMAATETGALRIAAYHYGSLGRAFAIERRQAHEHSGTHPFQEGSFGDPEL